MAATEPVYISYLNYIGSGAPADGDQITRDNSTYPLNCVYTDRETGTTYVRKATTRVAATDWQAGGVASSVYGRQEPFVVEYTNAEILAMPTTVIEVLPAPGAGKAYAIEGVYMRGNIVSDYTNIHTTDAQLNFWMHDPVVAYLLNDGTVSRLSDFFAPGINGPKVYSFLTPLAFTNSFGLVAQIGDLNHMYENKSLTLEIWNGGNGDFTGGNAANSIKVTVLYSIIDVS
jgi:hypothetical protein